MVTIAVQRQMLIKSFGYGIMTAEFVPTPNQEENVKEDLFKCIRSSGIGDVLEIILDSWDSNRVFILMHGGQPPCIQEKSQIELSDIECLEDSAKAAMSDVFIQRIATLKADLNQ
jgi:hypothetical protein